MEQCEVMRISAVLANCAVFCIALFMTMYAFICTDAFIFKQYICIYVCMHIYMLMCKYVCIYIHAYICINIYKSVYGGIYCSYASEYRCNRTFVGVYLN